MPFPSDFTIGICGGGLAGLALALTLTGHGYSCTVYEAANDTRGAISSLGLTPNGQAALEPLGILPALEKHSIVFSSAKVHNASGDMTGTMLVGNKEHFGHEYLRIKRIHLVQELIRSVEERGIAVLRGKKFVSIVSESEDGITIKFADDTTATHSLLIAADGIYSSVRQALYPEVELQYVGTLAVGGSVPLEAMSAYDSSCVGMYRGKNTTCIMAQDSADSWVVAHQGQFPDLGKEGWKALARDPKRLREFLEQDKDQWAPAMRHALENARDDSLYPWAMHVVPKLDSWRSPNGRILLIGDAAHAIPPESGQGANMAFEDGYTLGLVLQNISNAGSVNEALDFWQKMRQERLQAVLDMTQQVHKMRQSQDTWTDSKKTEAYKFASTQDGRIEQIRWLYAGIPKQEEAIKAWAAGKKD